MKRTYNKEYMFRGIDNGRDRVRTRLYVARSTCNGALEPKEAHVLRQLYANHMTR